MKTFLQFFLEQLDASVLSRVSSKDLGMFNSVVRLPDKKPYGFWIDKHGNFIPVFGGWGSHMTVGHEIIERANAVLGPYEQLDLNKIDSVYDFLLVAGWIRIMLKGGTLYWETMPGQFPTPTQRKLMSFIKDFYDLKKIEEG